MDTLSAFARGEANRGKDLMVFDWDKAARYIKENNILDASAGLSGDWEWTGGEILRNGKPVPREDTYTYLASTWATPKLDADDDMINCYIMKSDVPEEWGTNYASIYWPESALKILNGE
jgi:hypothetical protein